MDQFVSSAGCEGKLLLLDCRSLDYREVSMRAENGSNSDAPVLVITNSNVKHDLGDGEYPIRVRQCKEATDILKKVNPSIQSLRDATMKDVEAAAKSAGLEGVLLQRARHVVSENERTVKTADALEKGDWETVGKLMNDSHTSMRDDYEVSCEEIDVLVDLAQKFGDGVYGSRLTGGGFGGCTVTLVKKDASQELMEYLKMQYEAKTGTNCVCFETTPAIGAKAIDLV
jgi:galactokinase